MIYSGYIDCGGSEADYEFEYEGEDALDAMGQLNWLLDTGTLQIMDNEPKDSEDEDEDF